MTDEVKEWRTFSLTYVEYPEDDPTSKIFAILSLTPVILVIASIGFFFAKRDLHTIVYGAGMILNELINNTIKNFIKEPRPNPPNGSRKTWQLFHEYGMPSSHSQFMFFWATFIALFVLFRLKYQEQRWWKIPTAFSCYLLASAVAYGRIHLYYHTLEQVLWGTLIGTGVAIVYFGIIQCVFTPWFPWIASTRLANFFLIRDDTLIPNVMFFEYSNSRKEAQRRLRNLAKNK